MAKGGWSRRRNQRSAASGAPFLLSYSQRSVGWTGQSTVQRIRMGAAYSTTVAAPAQSSSA